MRRTMSLLLGAAALLTIATDASAQITRNQRDQLLLANAYRQQMFQQLSSPFGFSSVVWGLNQRQFAQAMGQARSPFARPVDRGEFLRVLGQQQIMSVPYGNPFTAYQLQLRFNQGTLPDNPAVNNYIIGRTYQQMQFNWAQVFYPQAAMAATAPWAGQIYFWQTVLSPRAQFSFPGSVAPREEAIRFNNYHFQTAIQYQQRIYVLHQLLTPQQQLFYNAPVQYLTAASYARLLPSSYSPLDLAAGYSDAPTKSGREPIAGLFLENPGERELELGLLYAGLDGAKAKLLFELAIFTAGPGAEVAELAAREIQALPGPPKP